MIAPPPNSLRAWQRYLLFRILAVLVGCAVVVSIECFLRLAGWGRIEDAGDPYVGFSNVVPLFVPNGESYETNPSRLAFFRPDSFAVEKPAGEFRIFCLGGSTVQGRPYAIETSFTSWLELSLQAAEPSRAWQVVNCGGVSYASYRLLPIMKEALQYQPDLFIVYTGHNEFLEDRSYPNLKQRPNWLKRIHEGLLHSRIYGVAQQLQPEPAATEKTSVQLSTEVEALLDYQGGLAQYHRDDAWRAGVIAHFEHNLRRMARVARTANVPLILINPVANIGDTPPFKSEISATLTTQQQDGFANLWEQAKSSSWEDMPGKRRLLAEALAIDDRHASAHFLMGRIHAAEGNARAAKLEYVRAKDEDICPLRIVEPMYDAITRVSRDAAIPLVDVRAYFESVARDGIPGDKELIDHVHPHLDGHQAIATQLLEQLVEQGIVQLQAGWRERQKQLYQHHWTTLPSNYFPESQARLEGLRTWAAGRATLLRLPKADSDESAK